MTPRFEIVDAKRYHCGQMARMLRAEHQRIAAGTGTNLHKELVSCFDQSSFRKAWLINGNLAAVGGVMGTLASPSGHIWLAMTDEATDYPGRIVREARRQLAELMKTKQEVMTTILLDDDAARRLAVTAARRLAAMAARDRPRGCGDDSRRQSRVTPDEVDL